MDPQEPTVSISEEEFRIRVIMLLESIESEIQFLASCVRENELGNVLDVNIRNQ